MNKVVRNAREALEKAGIRDGMTIMSGGFGELLSYWIIHAAGLPQA
ncbi:MAG: hypothetical protein U1A27_10865 [Phycisphaerae bacterium]